MARDLSFESFFAARVAPLTTAFYRGPTRAPRSGGGVPSAEAQAAKSGKPIFLVTIWPPGT